MLCSKFLVLLIHLGSLNEGWYIYKIVKPVDLIGVVVLALNVETNLKYTIYVYAHARS